MAPAQRTGQAEMSATDRSRHPKGSTKRVQQSFDFFAQGIYKWIQICEKL